MLPARRHIHLPLFVYCPTDRPAGERSRPEGRNLFTMLSAAEKNGPRDGAVDSKREMGKAGGGEGRGARKVRTTAGRLRTTGPAE